MSRTCAPSAALVEPTNSQQRCFKCSGASSQAETRPGQHIEASRAPPLRIGRCARSRRTQRKQRPPAGLPAHSAGWLAPLRLAHWPAGRRLWFQGEIARTRATGFVQCARGELRAGCQPRRQWQPVYSSRPPLEPAALARGRAQWPPLGAKWGPPQPPRAHSSRLFLLLLPLPPLLLSVERSWVYAAVVS